MSELYDDTFRARLLRQGLSNDEMADFVRFVEAELAAARRETDTLRAHIRAAASQVRREGYAALADRLDDLAAVSAGEGTAAE